MIRLETITPVNLAAFKAVRLRALREDPLAFGSTYERESSFSEDDWNQRLERWDGVRGIGLLAVDGSSRCGVAGVMIDDVDPLRAQLVSMWTAPEYRQRGVGRLLVERVADWAYGRGARVLGLMVTSINAGGLLFYERLGFTRTGEVGPYPNDPSLEEWVMARPLGELRAVDTSKPSR